ncbi:MAG: mechanosensitive ion channel family protein [bacterium JZ-2024 1]
MKGMLMMGWVSVIKVIVALSFIAGGFLVGLVGQKVFSLLVKKSALRAKWTGEEVIIGSFHNWIIFWCTLAGVYTALLQFPLKVPAVNILNKTLVVLLIFSVTIVLAGIAGGFVNIYQEKVKGALPSASILTNVTKIFILLIGLLVGLSSLGISILPILTGLGIGGLALGLALQDTLSNFIAGLQIVAAKQFRTGDYVKLHTGEEGFVVDITWRNTTIRDLSNKYIIVPNSKIAQSIIKNYYLPEREVTVPVQVVISYHNDLEKVERITREVAKEILKEVPGGISDFEPFVRYQGMDEVSIKFTVFLKGKDFLDQYLIKHEFLKRLHRRYQEEGVEIPIHLFREGFFLRRKGEEGAVGKQG